jgi:ribosomal protein S18 acetylase RimI-like enzyme
LQSRCRAAAASERRGGPSRATVRASRPPRLCALLYRIYASTRDEELAVVPWTAEQKEAFLRMQFTLQDAHYRGNYPGASFDVLVVGGLPAGRLYVSRRPEEIRVMDIALLPEFRRRGIGERVLRDVLAEADRDGVPVSLSVAWNNPARRLYERVGFSVVADQGVYLLMVRRAATEG